MPLHGSSRYLIVIGSGEVDLVGWGVELLDADRFRRRLVASRRLERPSVLIGSDSALSRQRVDFGSRLGSVSTRVAAVSRSKSWLEGDRFCPKWSGAEGRSPELMVVGAARLRWGSVVVQHALGCPCREEAGSVLNGLLSISVVGSGRVCVGLEVSRAVEPQFVFAEVDALIEPFGSSGRGRASLGRRCSRSAFGCGPAPVSGSLRGLGRGLAGMVSGRPLAYRV